MTWRASVIQDKRTPGVNDMSTDQGFLAQASCPGGTLYVIRAGDTLGAIAGRFGTSVEAIVAANPGIQPLNLQIGQTICIPGPAGLCPGGRPYTIQPGDTFFLIAQRLGISLQALVAANPQADPNRLQIGQVICIPIPVVPPPRPLCCTTLALVGAIPLSQQFPGGVVLIKPAATATEAVAVTFAASGLPAPEALGSFNTYTGSVVIPGATTRTPPAVYTVVLTSIQIAANQPITWAGTLVVPTQIPSNAALEVRPFSTATGQSGELLLTNTTGVC